MKYSLAFLLLALYALFLTMGEFIDKRQLVMKIFTLALFLPYLANSAGWIMTELGRAPWVVYGLMKIEDAVSPTVSSGMVLISLLGFSLVYGLLMVADIYLLKKYAVAGPGSGGGEVLDDQGGQFPSPVSAQG